MITIRRIAAAAVTLAAANWVQDGFVELKGFELGIKLGQDNIINSGAFIPRDYCHQQDRMLAKHMKDHIDYLAEAFDTTVTYETAPSLLPSEDGVSLQYMDFPVAVQELVVPEFQEGSLNPDLFNEIFERSVDSAIFSSSVLDEAAYEIGCGLPLATHFSNSSVGPMSDLVYGALSAVYNNPDKFPAFPDWEIEELRRMEPILRQMGQPLKGPGQDI